MFTVMESKCIFQVFYLQKEIKLKGHDLQDTNEQNILLQQTLHHQQQMLQQETIRNGELEDNQIKLEKQVQYHGKSLRKDSCLNSFICIFVTTLESECLSDNWGDSC